MIMLSFDNRLGLIQKRPDEFEKFLDGFFEQLAAKIYDKSWAFINGNEEYKTAQLARLLISPKLVSTLKVQIADTLND